MGRNSPCPVAEVEPERRTDIVGSIYDIGKIERLALASLTAAQRRPKEVPARKRPEPAAG
jgi:hypothetical protein